MKTKMILKRLCLVLVALMFALTMFSCSEEKTPVDTGTETDTSAEDETEVIEDYRTLLPNVTFGGSEVSIFCYDLNEEEMHFIGESDSADEYQQSVYSRNAMIEDKYEVILEIHTTYDTDGSNGKGAFVTACMNAVLSGRSDYDIILPQRFYSLEKNGYLLNLSNSDVLNLDNPYYAQGINDKLNLNGNMYMIVGYANSGIVSNSMVLFSNYYIEVDLGIHNDIIDAINNKEWTIDKMTDDQIREIFEVNLLAPVKLIAKASINMKKNRWGRIINIGSISGIMGEANASLYSSTKSGLVGLTRALALELAEYNITVNTVNPGWVDTEMGMTSVELSEFFKDEILESIPQRRFVQPVEIAKLVKYLVSEDAKGITGQSINLCAGLSVGI